VGIRAGIIDSAVLRAPSKQKNAENRLSGPSPGKRRDNVAAPLSFGPSWESAVCPLTFVKPRHLLETTLACPRGNAEGPAEPVLSALLAAEEARN